VGMEAFPQTEIYHYTTGTFHDVIDAFTIFVKAVLSLKGKTTGPR